MAKFVATIESVSVTATKTIIEFTAAADAICILHEARISQDASETSTQEVAQILRKTAAGTGTSFTARLLNPNTDAAFGGTVRTNCTVEGTAGDIVVHEGFNILNGWIYQPVPDARIIVPPSGILALKFITDATFTVSGYIVFEEIG